MKKSLMALAPAIVLATIIFSLAVHAQAQSVTFIARFSGDQGSSTGVMQATDGNFYGAAGGATTGVVSVVTPSGTLDSDPQFVVRK